MHQNQYTTQPDRSREAIQAQLRAADDYRRDGPNREFLRAYDMLRAEQHQKALEQMEDEDPTLTPLLASVISRYAKLNAEQGGAK